MYFLVVDAGDTRERAQAFVSAYGGDLAHSSIIRFSTKSVENFDLDANDKSCYLPVLHLAFGVAKRKEYDEIETTLKLMYGPRFLGRSRKRRDQ